MTLSSMYVQKYTLHVLTLSSAISCTIHIDPGDMIYTKYTTNIIAGDIVYKYTNDKCTLHNGTSDTMNKIQVTVLDMVNKQYVDVFHLVV